MTKFEFSTMFSESNKILYQLSKTNTAAWYGERMGIYPNAITKISGFSTF